MKMGRKCRLVVGFAMLFSTGLLAQTVIDATVPIRKRLRNPTAGQAGSIGRKLPIQMALEFPSPKSNSNGTVNVVFLLTNIGQTSLTLPISPHPGDFEPHDKNQAYTVQHLHLYVTWNRVPDSVLPGGADLYGNETHPETLLTILPGKAVRVLAKFKVPKESAPEQGGAALIVAHAVLDLEALKTVGGQTLLNSDEIGFSSSPGFMLELP